MVHFVGHDLSEILRIAILEFLERLVVTHNKEKPAWNCRKELLIASTTTSKALRKKKENVIH